MHNPPPFRLGYRPILDGVRAIAVLMVMVSHAGQPFVRGGWIGVDIFFVLSGFLITSLLIEEWAEHGSIDLRQFYMRRILRLLPAAVAVLVVCLAASFLMADRAEAVDLRQAVLATFLYVANWSFVFGWVGDSALGHTWSLSIEEQFYLVWPPILAVLLARRLSARHLLGLLGAGILLLAAWRLWLLVGMDASVARVKYGSDTHADSLLAGCFVGVLATAGLLPRPGRLLALAAAAATATLAFLAVVLKSNGHAPGYGGYTVIAAAGSLVLIQLLVEPPRLVQLLLTQPPVVWIGKRSYGIYLWHWPIFYALIRLTDVQSLALPERAGVTVLQFAGSFLAAAASYALVERPFLRLKHLFRPAPATAPPLPARPNAVAGAGDPRSAPSRH